MTIRTPQDIINCKEANQRYYKLEENKQQKRDYMKARYRMHWGEIEKKKKWGGMRQENEDIKKLHEEWAQANGYRDNDNLNATNTERIIKHAKE